MRTIKNDDGSITTIREIAEIAFSQEEWNSLSDDQKRDANNEMTQSLGDMLLAFPKPNFIWSYK